MSRLPKRSGCLLPPRGLHTAVFSHGSCPRHLSAARLWQGLAGGGAELPTEPGTARHLGLPHPHQDGKLEAHLTPPICEPGPRVG